MSRGVEMIGQCFHGQYKGRTMHKSIVSPFPIKQEVRLPVEDFGRRTNFSLAWPTHPYIQSHRVRRNTRVVGFAHVFMSRIIRPLSSCAWTPSGYTTYTCFAVTMNQSGKSKGAILWFSGNCRQASFLDRDSETHSASASLQNQGILLHMWKPAGTMDRQQPTFICWSLWPQPCWPAVGCFCRNMLAS